VLDEAARAARAAYRAGFEAHDPSAALRALTDWADALNKYLVRQEPWKRPGREALTSGVLGVAAQQLAQIALRLHPAMPVAAARLWRMLGLGEDPAREIAAGVDLLELETLPVAGRRVSPGEAVFPRLDRKAVFGDLASAAPPAPAPGAPEARSAVAGPRAGSKEGFPVTDTPAPPPAPPPDGLISIDDFAKVHLRCAKVLVCERHPNAEKLLRLEVDMGGETRQLVAGIASAYQPEDLVGRTIIVVANLKPAKLRGLESQGMLLAATGPDGVPHVLGPDGEVPPGSKVS
jgi:methionyl-tRNA synthetase